ncbi:hypothetical protein FRC18_012353 [Serendipita sp. 400]|nr:hypothetical protein FRC18_012353 [Serendipita sp. 400]
MSLRLFHHHLFQPSTVATFNRPILLSLANHHHYPIRQYASSAGVTPIPTPTTRTAKITSPHHRRLRTPNETLRDTPILPPDGTTTTINNASAWEKEPAVRPKSRKWMAAVVLLWFSGPIYAFYTWLNWDPERIQARLSSGKEDQRGT